MKILWVINVPLPEASILLGEEPIPFGGWLINASKYISNIENVELSIAFPSNKANKHKELIGKNIKYYPFYPIKVNNSRKITNNKYFQTLLQFIEPDIVHIYGTEMVHTLSFINACDKLDITTTTSIQGLVSIIQKHMYSNLPFRVIFGKTLRNLILNDHIHGLKKTFNKRGYYEIEALRKSNHIIGRTTWDKACSKQINPNAKYHHCNEILRDEFYNNKWSLNNCERYSIFLSQGQYPIKGLHYMLEAMPLILDEYPQAKIYISGKNIIKNDTFKDKLLMTYYGKYIKKIIIKFKLDDAVIFTGPLDEKNMCLRYLRSNVFVCPSSIENSPNSLGEAMILGLPSIASYVGGIPDLLVDKQEGYLYQHDAPYMLAHYVCELFKNNDIASRFSNNASNRAQKTHNISVNYQRLFEIYTEINKSDNSEE